MLIGIATVALLAGGYTLARMHGPETPDASLVSAEADPLLVRPEIRVVESLPQLKQRLDHMAATRQFTGAVLVARGNEVLFRQTYGKANYEQQTPFELDTRFRLASVSKQFTGVAVLKLQDEGKLSVNDPVCQWIQPCPERWANVRIHHLISHTSGIPDLMAQANWGQVRVTPHSPEQLLANATRYGLQFQPGEKVRYNNVGFNLAAYIVAKASGMSFEDYLQKTFFEPLGMTQTGSDVHANTPGLAMGYGLFPQGLTPQPLANVSVVHGAGALYSTMDDLLMWNLALHNGRILKPESYADLIRDHSPEDTPKERGRPHRAYGYGVFMNSLGERVSPSFSEPQIYHTGSWSGFRNLVSYEPTQKITVVVLSNNYHLRDQVFLLSQQAMAEALGHPFPTSMSR
ncbi:MULTISPECIES: serine hydrolase domain-containing protein [unclassified Brevundimonas]|uniref:serine hydrolase domain-containing protein n=1 Tax=unclassified Brevundimonas TaxID=2622653 RepID=UPI0025C16D0B|nr:MULTISPECIES: serine hydrolase domain-containing protein [unclassified Brevundimonas]